MTAEQWIPGPPPGRGRYWVHWQLKSGPRVEAVEISPALIHYDDPNAKLLIKTLRGAAYEFEPDRDDITHHMPLVPPPAPGPASEALDLARPFIPRGTTLATGYVLMGAAKAAQEITHVQADDKPARDDVVRVLRTALEAAASTLFAGDEPQRTAGVAVRPCTNSSPRWFTGRWRDWHRGHGCDKDDGKPRTAEGEAEIKAGGAGR